MADDVCPAYHRIHGHASRVERCAIWTQPDSPLAGGAPPELSGSAARWRTAAALVLLAAIALGGLWYRVAHPRRRARA